MHTALTAPGLREAVPVSSFCPPSSTVPGVVVRCGKDDREPCLNIKRISTETIKLNLFSDEDEVYD